MSSTIGQPLLENEERTYSSRIRKKHFLIAFGVVSTLMLLGCLLKQSEPERAFGLVPRHRRAGSAQLMSGSDLRGAALGSTNATDLLGERNSQCWNFPGGTCNVHDCLPFRRATCTSHALVFHICSCPTGCAGADFACHDTDYTKVADKFQLTNSHWPDQHLYVPTFFAYNQLRVSTTSTDTFSLHEVPGKNSKDGLKRYMFASTSSPDYVVALRANKADDITGLPSTNEFEVDVIHELSDPTWVFWIVCKPKSGAKGLQFGVLSSDGYYVWAYVHTGSWLVYGWFHSVWGAPDDRAQWIPDSTSLEESITDECPENN